MQFLELQKLRDLDLDLDLGSGRGHTGAHKWSRSTKFDRNRKNLLWTYVQTYGRTDGTLDFQSIRSSPGDDLKINRKHLQIAEISLSVRQSVSRNQMPVSEFSQLKYGRVQGLDDFCACAESYVVSNSERYTTLADTSIYLKRSAIKVVRWIDKSAVGI